MKIKLFATVLSILIITTGCSATTQRLSSENENLISKVYINQEIEKAEEMYYFAPGAIFGALFGVVGAIADAEISASKGQIFEKFANENDIYIKDIFYKNFIEELNESGRFQIVDSKELSDAVISINIKQYGFSVPNGFSSNIVPILNVKCEMYDRANDKKLWQAGSRTTPLRNPAKSFKPEAAIDEPTLISHAWVVASDFVAEKIVKDL